MNKYKFSYIYEKEFYGDFYIIMCFTNILDAKIELCFENIDKFNLFKNQIDYKSEINLKDLMMIYDK